MLSSTAFSLIFHTYVHVRIEVVQYRAKLSEVMRVKFVEIRPFVNMAVISSGSKNSGFEN